MGLAVVWLISLGWLTIAWAIHLRHLGPSPPWRRLDLVIRWLALVALAVRLNWPDIEAGDIGPIIFSDKLTSSLLRSTMP